MAFLLSPKTGESVTYALTTAYETSINGGAAREYTDVSPGVVHPGDVLTWSNGTNAKAYYYDDPDGEPLSSTRSTSPYTVQSIEGATEMHLENGMPL